MTTEPGLLFFGWNFLWGLVIQNPSCLLSVPAVFPEVYITCHPPGGKPGGLRAWEGQPRPRGEVWPEHCHRSAQGPLHVAWQSKAL